MKKIFDEFREFAMKGNVIDMAVGVVVGAAFGKIVTSLVSDVIMPPLGKLLGGVDFSDFYINLSDGSYATLAEAQKAGAITLNYGLFINAIISFLIVAAALFMVIRTINRLKKTKPVTEATDKPCPHCFSNIDKRATRCPQCTAEVQ